MGTVYLLHFDHPYKHARHYLGYTRDMGIRMKEHSNGTGARLTQVVLGVGGSWCIARTWDGSRTLERKLKSQKNSPKLCPICRERGK